ncbi:MAG: sensor histidine kinase [Oscillospiraceae bacterium]|jgi:signal transduction histidine kinase
MPKLLNKSVILLCCLFLYISAHSDLYIVAPIIIIIIYSSLATIFESPAFRIGAFLAFCAAGIFYPELTYFVPLALYDIYLEKKAYIGFAALIPVSVSFSEAQWEIVVSLILLSFISYLIKRYALKITSLNLSLNKLRDDAREFEFRMNEKNRDLMEKQDYEINLATLRERNRIARDIHDSVGHVMSSSILQVGALIATAKDESVKKSLEDLKQTLTSGMDSIRNSIHDLHDDSLDLDSQLYSLVKDFTFCRLTYDYEAETHPDKKTTYSVIAIVREALSNIIKHSGATAAGIVFRELPGFFQLIVTDNGAAGKTDFGKGIGLTNIISRVESLNGHINIDTGRGFKLFISIPKDPVVLNEGEKL